MGPCTQSKVVWYISSISKAFFVKQGCIFVDFILKWNISKFKKDNSNCNVCTGTFLCTCNIFQYGVFFRVSDKITWVSNISPLTHPWVSEKFWKF